MNSPEPFAATLIDSAARTYSAETVERQGESLADDGGLLSKECFLSPLADTQGRITHLAEALALECPGIFEEFLRWTKVARRARGWSDAALIGNLEAMVEVLDRRLPPPAAQAARAYIETGLKAYDEGLPQTPSHIVEGSGEHKLTLKFLEAILTGRMHQAMKIINEAVDDGLPVQDAYTKVVTVAQREVGLLWQTGQLDIGEEHLGSRIVERVLFELMRRADAPASGAPKVLVSCGANNQHEIGPRVVADQFTLAGWEAFFLGASIPASSLAITATDLGVDLIAISIPLSIQLRATRALIQEVKQELGDACPPILVGGSVFRIDPGIGNKIGADAATSELVDGPRLGQALLRQPD